MDKRRGVSKTEKGREKREEVREKRMEKGGRYRWKKSWRKG